MRKAIQLSYQVTSIIVALFWLFQASAVAGIYKWRDDQGKLHFTDDRSKIPLKYRENVEKLKGVSEPKPPKPSMGQGESSGKGETVVPTETVQEEASTGSAESSEKAPEKSKYSKEQIALLKQVKVFLTREWATKVKIVENIEPTKLNGKYYVSASKKSIPKKKQMVKKLRDAVIPSLREVRAYLKKSYIQDLAEKQREDDEMMVKVQRIRKRMEADVIKEKELLDKLKTDLGPEDKPEAPDPEAFMPGSSSGITLQERPKKASGWDAYTQ